MKDYPYKDKWLPLERKYVDLSKIADAIKNCPDDHDISFHIIKNKLNLCYIDQSTGLIDKFIIVSK